MSLRLPALTLALVALSGCASLSAPSADVLARLPVVTFPDTPPAGDFVFRLPAGKPIPAHVAVAGSALASGAEQTLTVTLPRDLYVHRRWISEDRQTWKPWDEVLSVDVFLALPSDEHPKPGEMRLTIDRKSAQ